MSVSRGINRPKITQVGFDALTAEMPTGCVVWIGGKTAKGYGEFALDHQRWYAHRYAWTRAFGDIPEGMQVLHKCDNPPCVNPAHLFLGTNADNHADKIAKGRQRGAHAGEDNHKAVLTVSDVKWIRYLRSLGGTQQRIAEIIGAKRATVRAVLDGRTWNHVSV